MNKSSDIKEIIDELEDEQPGLARILMENLMVILHHGIRIQPNSPQKWGVAFATANPICAGKSMSQVASQLGVSRAIISHEARRFIQETGLPPSSYMGTEEAATTAHKSRTKTIEQCKPKRTKAVSI